MFQCAIQAETGADVPDGARAPLSRRAYLGIAAAIWVVAVLVMLVLHAHAIATLAYPDVDDQLRLVEVRDWIGGQAFWDVSQHRMNPPFGAPMHWSRLVDMPLAAVILLLRPWLGYGAAETVAAVAIPMLTLGVVMLVTGLIARRLAGDAAGLLATAMAATALATLPQLQPLRVDHHGWEIALSLIALHAALDPRGRRSGLIAGLAIAVALQISLEVLPFAVALGGAVALRWALDGDRAARDRLVTYGAALALAEILLFGALHDPRIWADGYCDAVSPPHLLALVVAGAGLALIGWRPPATRPARLFGLAIVGVAAAAAFRSVPPHCGLDAFSMLEPIVRAHWYEQILEGRPVWHAGPANAIAITGFPLLAIPCAILAWREAEGARWQDWAVYTLVLIAATMLGMLVARATALANVIALPAAMVVALRLLARVQRSRVMLVRVLGSTALLGAFSPWAIGAVANAVIPIPPAKPAAAADCTSGAGLAALGAIPATRLFAPFDLGPAILLRTDHAVLASSHHRNHVAMAQELTALIGSDAVAYRILAARGMRYVVVCPHESEIVADRDAAPAGFAAHLDGGRAPAWLRPVKLPGTALQVWKITD